MKKIIITAHHPVYGDSAHIFVNTKRFDGHKFSTVTAEEKAQAFVSECEAKGIRTDYQMMDAA